MSAGAGGRCSIFLWPTSFNEFPFDHRVYLLLSVFGIFCVLFFVRSQQQYVAPASTFEGAVCRMMHAPPTLTSCDNGMDNSESNPGRKEGCRGVLKSSADEGGMNRAGGKDTEKARRQELSPKHAGSKCRSGTPHDHAG